MSRLFSLMVFVWLSVGCADNKPLSYYQPPPTVPLQDPMPGQGIIYLFRAPHDTDALQIDFVGKKPFTLPASTYAVLNVNPGEHAITGVVNNNWGAAKTAFLPVRIQIKEGQRAFLYVSGTTQSSISIGAIIPIKGGVLLLPGDGNLRTVDDSRTWKECNELDAQGFISISKLAHVG